MLESQNVFLYMHFAMYGLVDTLVQRICLVCTPLIECMALRQMSGTVGTLCYYSWDGNSNSTCSIVGNVVTIGTTLKLFIAFFCEAYFPCGLRRKPYMVVRS